MGFLEIVVLSLVLVVLAVLLHYEVLRAASGLTPSLVIPPRSRILVVIFAAFLGHMMQICLYAGGFWFAEHILHLGSLTGAVEGNPLDYFYFSAATFTTLGIGDVVVVGSLRLLAGTESLNGLVLITWSASFTYLSMEQFWKDHR
ncbi:MAG: ion channel [Amaricoccus sp.]